MDLHRRSRRRIAAGILSAVALAVAGPAAAQPATGTVRIALVPQWVVNQHRPVALLGASRPMPPEFRAALDRGVVDRAVFWWQRGLIQRSSLVSKPIRLVTGAEAAALGGRGEFALVALRPPSGAAAWTEVEVAARAGEPDQALVLEVGGDLNTVTQVLESLFVTEAGGSLRALGLERVSLLPGSGVSVITAPFGTPVVVEPTRFRGAGGVGFLVARSQVEAIRDGAVTTNGLADLAPNQAGAWREGDRVYIRVPLSTLRAGVPGIVLGWKDRVEKSDPDGEFRTPARLEVPLLR